MRQTLIPQRVVVLLVAAAVILLVAGFVTLGLGELLAAMGDLGGSVALKYIALGCGALCLVDLICLILVQAVRSLLETDDSQDSK